MAGTIVNSTAVARDKELAIIGLMVEHGGGFFSRLGHALYFADPDNAERIKAAFPEKWAEYERLAGLKEE